MLFQLVVFLIIIALLLRWISKRRFPVHKNGGIIISGASTGIGRDAAIALAKAGYTVCQDAHFLADAGRCLLGFEKTLTQTPFERRD